MKTDHKTTHIFTGPTLSHAEGLALQPDAYFHAPIQCGDLMRLLPQKPKTIVIIDGIFENRPSIWHKEILTVIQQGITIIGCSSIGALRAAELSRHGMIGHGKIYQHYLDGTLQDDDEVAVAHYDQSLDYSSHSEALINTRYTLQLAVKTHILSHDQAQSLINILKKTFYWSRTILHALQHSDLPDDLQQQLTTWWPQHRVDQKKQDAQNTLTQLSTLRLKKQPVRPVTNTIQSLNLFKQHTITHNPTSLAGILEKHITYCLLTLKYVPPNQTPHPLFQSYRNWLSEPQLTPPPAVLNDLINQHHDYIEQSRPILALYHYPHLLPSNYDDARTHITQCIRQQLWGVITHSYDLAKHTIHPTYLEQYMTQYRQLKQLQKAEALTECLKALNLSNTQWQHTMIELSRYKYLINDSRLCYFELTENHLHTNWNQLTSLLIQSVRNIT